MTQTPFNTFPFDGILGVGMLQASLEKQFNFMGNFTVDNTPLGLCGTSGCQAAFDTGTNAIAAPDYMVQTLVQTLNIQQDCSTYDSLPTLGFSLGGKVHNLDKRDYIKRIVTNDGVVQCYHQFLPLNLSGKKKDVILLGDPFLRRYYAVFDRESLHIGLGLSKHRELPGAVPTLQWKRGRQPQISSVLEVSKGDA